MRLSENWERRSARRNSREGSRENKWNQSIDVRIVNLHWLVIDLIHFQKSIERKLRKSPKIVQSFGKSFAEFELEPNNKSINKRKRQASIPVSLPRWHLRHPLPVWRLPHVRLALLLCPQSPHSEELREPHECLQNFIRSRWVCEWIFNKQPRDAESMNNRKLHFTSTTSYVLRHLQIPQIPKPCAQSPESKKLHPLSFQCCQRKLSSQNI